MCKSEFEQESYGRLNLMRPIHKGVGKFGHTPVFHSAWDFCCPGT